MLYHWNSWPLCIRQIRNIKQRNYNKYSVTHTGVDYAVRDSVISYQIHYTTRTERGNNFAVVAILGLTPVRISGLSICSRMDRASKVLLNRHTQVKLRIYFDITHTKIPGFT